MKKLNKKGFTIVELVIVIAVIAILAAVLIPTFSNVIEKANKSAALSNAKNNMTEDLVIAEADYSNMKLYVDNKTTITKAYYIVKDKTTYTYSNSSFSPTLPTDLAYKKYATINDGVVTIYSTSGAATVDLYEVELYKGVYNGTTWVQTVNNYKCTFTVASGTWTVEKVTQ